MMLATGQCTQRSHGWTQAVQRAADGRLVRHASQSQREIADILEATHQPDPSMPASPSLPLPLPSTCTEGETLQWPSAHGPSMASRRVEQNLQRPAASAPAALTVVEAEEVAASGPQVAHMTQRKLNIREVGGRQAIGAPLETDNPAGNEHLCDVASVNAMAPNADPDDDAPVDETDTDDVMDSWPSQDQAGIPQVDGAADNNSVACWPSSRSLNRSSLRGRSRRWLVGSTSTRIHPIVQSLVKIHDPALPFLPAGLPNTQTTYQNGSVAGMGRPRQSSPSNYHRARTAPQWKPHMASIPQVDGAGDSEEEEGKVSSARGVRAWSQVHITLLGQSLLQWVGNFIVYPGYIARYVARAT